MNQRQLYVCAMALFDDGWPTEAIRDALDLSDTEVSATLTGKGEDPDLRWQRHAVKDKDGLIIVRDESGNIVKRLKPQP